MEVEDLVYDSSWSEEDKLEHLRGYFRIVQGPEQNEFWCKKCKAGWALPLGNRHPGNILALLNHAFGHLEKKRRK